MPKLELTVGLLPPSLPIKAATAAAVATPAAMLAGKGKLAKDFTTASIPCVPASASAAIFLAKASLSCIAVAQALLAVSSINVPILNK